MQKNMNIKSVNTVLVGSLIFFFVSCFGTGLTRSQIQESRMLVDKSKFLSGQTDLQDSRLSEFVKKENYEKYKEKIQRYLNNFRIRTIEPIKKWREEQIANVKSENAFYPFSGPDFLNIYSLYPEAKRYVMVGLETSGFIPNFEKISDQELTHGLGDMQNALESISRRNFFVTKSMRKNVNKSRIKGTIPIFLTYLGFLDLTPISIRHIKINQSGQIEALKDEASSMTASAKGFNGVEIQFIEKDKPLIVENIKSIYYFSADISNLGFRKNPGIMKFLNEIGTVAVSFKAASYLPHGDRFSTLRNYVHKNAEVIVMDDTGPKINSFNSEWDIQVFGTYNGPISDFSEKYQKPLAKLFKDQKPKKIDFRFGYGKTSQQFIIKLSKKFNHLEQIESRQ